jgi:hypothetical protein
VSSHKARDASAYSSFVLCGTGVVVACVAAVIIFVATAAVAARLSTADANAAGKCKLRDFTRCNAVYALAPVPEHFA